MKKKLTDRWESEWLDKASLFRDIKGKKLVKRIFLMRIFRDVGLKSADLKSVPFVTLI